MAAQWAIKHFAGKNHNSTPPLTHATKFGMSDTTKKTEGVKKPTADVVRREVRGTLICALLLVLRLEAISAAVLPVSVSPTLGEDQERKRVEGWSS